MMLRNALFTLVAISVFVSCSTQNSKHDLRGRTVGNAAEVNKKNVDPQSQALDPSASGGSGGAFGLREFSYVTSNSVELKVKTAPSEDAGNEAQGLLMYFHSEGAADYDWMFPTLVAVGKEKNMIPVAVKIANATSWGTSTDLDSSAITNLVQEEFFKNYNVKKNRIIFIGASTGADYLVDKMTNDKGFQIARGAVLLCGGNAKKLGAMLEGTSDDWKAQFKVASVMSSSDPKFSEIAGLKEYFNKLKINYESIDPNTAGHCRFDAKQQLGDALEKIENK